MVLACAGVAAAEGGRVDAVELLAGPLIGHTTTTSTRIWVETSAAADSRRRTITCR